MKLIAVVGLSGSGKTRLITRLIPEFRKRGLEVAVIKRCSREFLIDVEGKDSWRFREAGAEAVALTSPRGMAVLRKATAASDPRFIARNDLVRADIVLVEGGKKLRGLKKVEVVRREVGLDLLTPAEDLVAVVADGPVATDRPVFGPDDTAVQAEFLLTRLEKETSDLPLEDAFAKRYFARRDQRVLGILRKSTVGIAGAGGLGSNVALSLARAGVGRLIIADNDRIEPANLNRQQYFVDQVGRKKVEALREILLRVNPYSTYMAHAVRVNARNVARLFGEADVMVEAFDKAAAKQMLIETWLTRFPDRPIVAASGLAGFGANGKLHTRRLGRLYICGDEQSQPQPGISPMAPRVAVVANFQANLVVELLVKKGGRRA